MASLSSEYQAAQELLQRLRTPEGFLASSLEEDNYKRIWARDSMVCGLAALLLNDQELIRGLRDSLLSLAAYQHESGMIPSNVDPRTGDVSYGSLVGRIDANTWFIIGACLYQLNNKDKQSWDILKPKVLKTRDYLKHLEFNNKGWLYTPLSGNWADEYPVHGYTLYDNALRIWAERLMVKIGMEPGQDIEAKTLNNFWPVPEGLATSYHKAAYQDALAKNVNNYAAFILPGHYDLRFDAAGNALALLLWPLELKQASGFRDTMERFKSEFNSALIPAFWPVVGKDSYDWSLLKNNYSFSFKNHPGDFHNGGVWPVWMGLFALGMATKHQPEAVIEIARAFEKAIAANENWQFQEYLNPLSKELGGKSQMGYSASGVVFMQTALHSDPAEYTGLLGL